MVPISTLAATETYGDTVDTSTLSTLLNAAATTPVAVRLYGLHAPRKMEVLPGGQPDAAGGKSSIDTLDSARPLGVRLCKVCEIGDMV